MKTPTINALEMTTIQLRTVDIVLLGYLTLLSLLEVVFRVNVAAWQTLVLQNIFAVAVYLGILPMIQRRGSSAFPRSACRILSIVVFTSFIYNEMGRIIHLIFPYWWDGVINSFEESLFQGHPTVWFQSIATPWLTELMMFGYVIYVPLIPAVAFLCMTGATKREEERYITELTVTYLLCDLIYVLVPVAGPSRALQSLHAVPLRGYFFTAITDYMIANVHLPGGAFPSAHCAATVVIVAALYRHRHSVGIAFFPIALLIFFSTVYGRFHYVTDVVAGILIAVAAIRVTPKLEKLFGQWNIGLALSVPAAPRAQRPVGSLISDGSRRSGGP